MFILHVLFHSLAYLYYTYCFTHWHVYITRTVSLIGMFILHVLFHSLACLYYTYYFTHWHVYITRTISLIVMFIFYNDEKRVQSLQKLYSLNSSIRKIASDALAYLFTIQILLLLYSNFLLFIVFKETCNLRYMSIRYFSRIVIFL